MARSSSRLVSLLVGAAVIVAMHAGCMPAEAPVPTRSPRAQQWFDRAQKSYQQADIDDAQDAVSEALRYAPDDADIKLLSAKIALSKLQYEQVLKLTENDGRAEALALRSRALWYAGNVKEAGAALQTLLQDPAVHDQWAKAIAKLASRGVGRQPYRITGGIVAAVEMPRVRGTAMVVPIEIDGDEALAMIATGTAEVVLDSAQRREPSWVSIRVAERVEFQDVPAVTQDLSGLSRQLGVPIKALLGVNFLRHANPTIDFLGRQFVVRSFEAPRPPEATSMPVMYARGGGMVLRSALQSGSSAAPAALMIDSAMPFPLALDSDGWGKAGVPVASLRPVAGEANLKQGTVPMIRLGAFDIPQIPAVMNQDIQAVEQSIGLDLDGLVGAGLLAGFRLTLSDGGRVLWLEEDGMTEAMPEGAEQTTPAQPTESESDSHPPRSDSPQPRP